ncbi:hypothetical protein [Nakamurella endophytica]|uniref:Uncharacterized protein n=1 Tax=Nakamurella endophytica TaxID=1748367 RepID=A0A917T7X7_9ACTN|nr:hypothetical protein [Nakamurella endophytica]GGM12606.1 hypothetical protein GCM10011594_35630 [Nakamurella endophytica]
MTTTVAGRILVAVLGLAALAAVAGAVATIGTTPRDHRTIVIEDGIRVVDILTHPPHVHLHTGHAGDLAAG